jgi:hypothetical protein
VLTVEDAEIYCCASSRDQAKILFQYASKFARELDHPNIVHRHLELRWCPDPDEPKTFTRYLRVLPAEAPRLYGLTPSLMFLDEMQALATDDVWVARLVERRGFSGPSVARFRAICAHSSSVNECFART